MSEDRKFDEPIFKKWFKAKTFAGFLSMAGWLDAGKVSIDIGQLDENGSPKSSTLVWTDALELAVYLRSVVNSNNSNLVYPNNEYTYYGGGSGKDGNPVSRILKISHWTQGKDKQVDKTSFAVKAGHFQASKSSSGAFMPDMSKPLSTDFIKISYPELAQMSYRLDLALYSYAAKKDDDVFRYLNGNAK